MSNEIGIVSQAENKSGDFSVLRKFFPSSEFSEINYEELPSAAIRVFEGYSRRFILPEEYKLRDFSNILMVQHDINDLTYVVKQTKTYSDTNGAQEDLVYFCDLLGNEYAGRSELRYSLSNKKSFFLNKPFVGYTDTEDALKRMGLGLRRVYLMNAVSEMFFNFPLYSDTLLSPQTKELWEKLVSEGKAKSFLERGKLDLCLLIRIQKSSLTV